MKLSTGVRAVWVMGIVGMCAGWGLGEPAPDPAELPRIPAKTLEEALEAFELRPGFRIEVAAAEPLVVDPVAIAFDEDGRMFVAEMRGYPEKREEGLGRIKRLEDSDGDGRFDKATDYAVDLKWPTSVLCWNGGVFVTASPDVLYLKDGDGDGVAEERRVVFTGFGAGQARLNMQALVNGLTWGPDGRIYGATASNGGVVKRPGPGEFKPVNLRGSDFSFDPGTLDLRVESGTAQYGMAFDDHGQRYVCSNSRHVMAVMYSWPWNKVSGLPSPLVDIAVDGGAAEVFRTSAVEPWRVVRTRWRVQGLVRGPVEGGGRAAGYFTSASGLTIYRGDAFPREFRGNLFVGDVGSNLVHRKVIERPVDRVQPVARRAQDEQKSEFLTSTDNWFRPVMCANGPDGALYVVDMCRETIEHPWSLPESIKQHLDLYSGSDRGRIWRVVPEGFVRPKTTVRSGQGLREILEGLGSANGWERDTAARLLMAPKWAEEAKVQMAGWIHALVEGDPAIRRQALRLAKALGGNAVEGWNEAGFLASGDPVVRRVMVSLANFSKSARLTALAEDPDHRVRFEVALRALDRAVVLDAALLATLAQNARRDPWILKVAAVAAAQRGLLSEVAAKQPDLEVAVMLLQAGKAAPGDEELRPLYEAAQKVASDDGAALSRREAATWLIGRDPATPATEFWKAIEGGEPSVALAAAEALMRRPGAKWNLEVLKRWPTLPPKVRGKFLPRLPDGLVIGAVKDKVLLPEEVDFQRRNALRRHAEDGLRKQAVELFGEPRVRSREEAAKHYRPALTMKGEGKRGEKIFGQRCVICHGLDESKAGPSLASLRNKGAPMLLENILAPDLEVAPQFHLWEVHLKKGGVLAGVIAEEGAGQLTLVQADGLRVVVERKEIARLTNLNRSLMPAGLEAGLSLEEMADLLQFVAAPE